MTPTTSRVSALVAGLAAMLLAGGCGGFSYPPGPSTVALVVPQTELDSGKQAGARVVVTDVSGRTLPSAPVTWQSSDPAALRVIPADNGQSATVIAGTKDGNATLTATAGGRSATVQFTIHGPKPIEVSLARDVQPIFTQTCALPECHGEPAADAAEDLLLTPGLSYGNTVNVPSTEVPRRLGIKRILPGDPNQSYLMAKIRGVHRQLGGNGARMPLSGSLSSAEIDKIAQWIAAGAKDN